MSTMTLYAGIVRHAARRSALKGRVLVLDLSATLGVAAPAQPVGMARPMIENAPVREKRRCAYRLVVPMARFQSTLLTSACGTPRLSRVSRTTNT